MYIIAYDVGTTGVKTCLFSVENGVKLIAGESAGYNLYILDNGGAEQDADEWWEAMCLSTKRLLEKTNIAKDAICGISFCSQMQGMVLVDEKGEALRRPMSYMDQRGTEVFKSCQTHGLCISGVNIFMLLKSLIATHAASTSVKDPLWKYKWVEKNEPEIFGKAYKWLDVKEYLICRCTGEFVMTKDSAYSTFLYDTRKGHEGWCHSLCKMYGVNEKHLPRIIKCTDVAGLLSLKAASELGLAQETPVYGGGGDATLIGVGAGCTQLGDTHIYSGTSGWVGTLIGKQAVDLKAMIAGVLSAEDGKYNYFAEMETAGKCFEWVKDHLVLDEIGIYLEKTHVTDSKEAIYESLYDYMSSTVEKDPAGANGVIFTPWLHGNRCPFEDPDSGGMFFNLRLTTGKTDMIRAVLEGICYHLRWMLECEDEKISTSKTIRFVGGGALSAVTCQMLADITGRTIETVEASKDVGSIGAAILAAVGSGALPSLAEAGKTIKAKERYIPDESKQSIYDTNYRVFKSLYAANKKSFAILNRKGQ